MGKEGPPKMVVVSGSAALDPHCQLLSDSPSENPPIVAVTASAKSAKVKELAARADIVVAGDEHIDPPALRAALSERGLRHVLCEGGPKLLGSLMEADMVDELCLTLATLVAGGQSSSLLGAPQLPTPLPFVLTSIMSAEGSVFLRLGRDRSEPRGEP